MAHFSEVNEDNIVVNVFVVDNNDCGGGDFPISEDIGRDFLEKILGPDKKYYQTSYNHNFRGHYGFPDCYYDEELDEFITPDYYIIVPDNGKSGNWDDGPQTAPR